MSDRSHDQSIAELEALLDVTMQMGRTIELRPTLQAIEQAALRVLACERASVFIYDRPRDELVSKVATGVDELRFSAQRGICGEVARTEQTINVPDAYADQRFNPDVDRQTGFRTRNMLTFPLKGFDGQLVGVLQVLNKIDGAFTAHDERLAEVFSAQAGVALQRQLLLDEHQVKQKLEHDLEIARRIQQELLPSEAPDVSGFEIAGWNRPADQTGGDCYDFYPLADGRLAITIADATGHGIGPALVVSECRALLRAFASTIAHPQEIVRRANVLLSEDMTEGRFVTAFFGLLAPGAHRIVYTSAGHGPLLWWNAADQTATLSDATDLPLGVLPEMDCQFQEGSFAPGDMLVVLTDGFFEWARPDGELFGMDRVVEHLRAHQTAPPADLITSLHAAVLDFAQGTPQADDLTAIAIRRSAG